MATSRGSHPFFAVHNQKSSFFACMSTLFLLASLSPAQQINQLPDAPVPQLLAQAAQPQGSVPDASAGNAPDIVIPPGTRIELVLTHPVDSHSKSPGDEIFAQTSAPVIIGDQVAIPAGTFVRGKVQKLTRDGTRAEMLMQSVSLVLPNAYVVPAGGPVNIESEEWTAWNNPTGASKAAIVLAPLLGIGLGTAIGAATDKPQTLGGGTISSGFPGGPTVPAPTLTVNEHRGLVIGGAVGGIVGLAVSSALYVRNHHFYIGEGAPLAMRLPAAIALPQAQVDDANQKAAANPAPVPVAPMPPPGLVPGATSNGTCYTPGSPGTPGTHIPGTPGVNGSPGTPDIDIPGTPPTPPTPYPCP